MVQLTYKLRKEMGHSQIISLLMVAIQGTIKEIHLGFNTLQHI